MRELLSANQSLAEASSLGSSLPPLLIEAVRVAMAVQQGMHGRRRAGVGETFWQFRPYVAGDDSARIDWRQSSRGDRLFIRQREWEAAQTVYLWADVSGSMRWRSDNQLPEKAQRARLLMLALAQLLLRGGERVAWMGRETVTLHGRAGLTQLAARLGDEAADNLPAAQPLARHAHAVLCSDFLAEPEALRALIGDYAARGIKGALIHILDPAEEELPFEGRIEMQGCENEVPLLLPNAGALRDAYRQRMQKHKGQLAHLAKSAGWLYLQHNTSAPAAPVLLQLAEYLSPRAPARQSV